MINPEPQKNFFETGSQPTPEMQIENSMSTLKRLTERPNPTNRSNSRGSIHPSNQHKPGTHMTTKSKSIIILLFFVALLAMAGLGCNTANGFGKDMEKAGEGIQNGTK
jgi:predicted small secreted protein